MFAISGRGPDSSFVTNSVASWSGSETATYRGSGNDGLAGWVDEVQRVAFVGGLELLPVRGRRRWVTCRCANHPESSPVRSDQGRDSAPSPVSNTPVSEIEPRMSAFIATETRSGPRVSTNTTRSISSALPASSPRARRRRGEELPGCQMAIRRIRGGLEEFAQQNVGIHRRCRGWAGSAARRGPWCREPVAPEELGTPAHPARFNTRVSSSETTPGRRLTYAHPRIRAREPVDAAVCRGPMGLSGNGLAVTLCPRTNGNVSRKHAPLPGSPHASSLPWCSRASSMEMARPSPVPPDRRTRGGGRNARSD